MKMLNPKVLAVALLIGTLPTLVTCEAENPQALFVYDAMALTVRQQCQIQPGQRAQAIIPFGILDLVLTNRYFLFPRFKNVMSNLQTITGEGPGSLQTETNILSVRGAKVWLDLGELTPLPGDTNYDVLMPYVIDGVQNTVAESVEPDQEGAVAVEVIKSEVGNILGDLIVANGEIRTAVDINVYVLLQAQTQSGEVVLSNEFAFPIKLCLGCLLFPTSSSDINEMPCYPGQDYGVPPKMCPIIAIRPELCPNY